MNEFQLLQLFLGISGIVNFGVYAWMASALNHLRESMALMRDEMKRSREVQDRAWQKLDSHGESHVTREDVKLLIKAEMGNGQSLAGHFQ